MKRIVFFLLALLSVAPLSQAADKKIVLVAGGRSHGPGEHEFRAGCLLLQQCLAGVPGLTTVVVSNGWPADVRVFDGASAVLIYSDGGGGHPFVKPDRLKVINDLVAKGVGIGAGHYGVEVEKGTAGEAMLKWTGGYFESFWSVNPHWDGAFTNFPVHPITRGVEAFKIRDEWYYHMRFAEGMKGVTPLLSAVPPDKTRGKPGESSSHGGNPEVQKHMGEVEHVMWCLDRPDGGRGFGFTGGHYHKNWADDNFRKVFLNALLWSAKIEVPKNGFESTVTPEQLAANLDPKGAPKPKAAASPSVTKP